MTRSIAWHASLVLHAVVVIALAIVPQWDDCGPRWELDAEGDSPQGVLRAEMAALGLPVEIAGGGAESPHAEKSREMSPAEVAQALLDSVHLAEAQQWFTAKAQQTWQKLNQGGTPPPLEEPKVLQAAVDGQIARVACTFNDANQSYNLLAVFKRTEVGWRVCGLALYWGAWVMIDLEEEFKDDVMFLLKPLQSAKDLEFCKTAFGKQLSGKPRTNFVHPFP